MKKIGIITFHNAHNYGAMLQAYALQQKLLENNEVEIIDFRNSYIDKNYKLFRRSRNPVNMIKFFINDLKKYKKNKKRYDKFEDFIRNNYILTKEHYNNEKKLKNKAPDFDIYITGSDQVWNCNIAGRLLDAYTLNFGKQEVKRISYAPSIGNSKIEEKYKQEYINKLRIINKISVREENARENLKKIIDKNIDVVLDPTLLLTREEWDERISEKIDDTKINQKYILAYVVKQDENYNKIVNYISKKTELNVVHFQDENKELKNVYASAYTEGPFEFVNLIKNAEYVICTSFHATVFSIIYNKKFWVIPHKETGSRVTNLLEKLGILDRVINNLEEFEKLNYDKEIDYEKVNKKLEEERKKSIDWLNNAINS